MSRKRLDAVRKSLRALNLDAMVINHLDHVRYLCGYTGSNGLLFITPTQAHFLTDFRYADQCRQEVKGARRHVMTKGLLIECLEDFPAFNKKNLRVGYSPSHMSMTAYDALRKALDKVLLAPAGEVVAELGWVKDKNEIGLIAKAAEIGDVAFQRVLSLLKPGVREREVAAELEYQMTMMGSQRRSFETIIASGVRSAMPHGEASNKKIKNGEFVTFDFGATVGGYASDMTRTVVVGKATTKQKKIYGIVLRAQKAGVRKVKAGVSGRAVDAVCRNIITRAGYGKEFGHGTGHGIGFPHNPIHTGPGIGSKSEDILKVNNVITIEPGIYLSGWGGVRIEDDVVVTRTGCRVLTHAPKNLLEV